MNWWEKQISLGWKGPIGRPRGHLDAPFPLRTGVRYRVSMNPSKSHLLQPGTDHAWCGLTLAPEDGWLIDTGYDAHYWVTEDTRKDTNWCGPCGKWREHWRQSAASPTLPSDSPVTQQEWAGNLGPIEQAKSAKLDAMASVVCGWFGGTTRMAGNE